MGARSSLGGVFQLMVLPKASAPARGPSSHQDRQLQPAPAPGSVVLRDSPPTPALPRPPVLRPWARPNLSPPPPPPHTLPRPATGRLIQGGRVAGWRVAAAVLDLPQGVGEYGADMDGPDMACSALGRHMMLPLRHGGLRLHMQSGGVSDAVFVAGACHWQAERNLKGRPAALCPLPGASGASIRERWSSLHARYTGQFKCDVTQM